MFIFCSLFEIKTIFTQAKSAIIITEKIKDR